MKKAFCVLAAVVAALVLAGCVAGNKAVPSTTIKWNPTTGQVDITAPKNSTLKGFEITRSGTNVSIKLTEGSFANDPDVVGQSYAGQAAMLREGLAIGQRAIETGIALGTGRLPPAQPPPVVITNNVAPK
jgi:hypothetical protein